MRLTAMLVTALASSANLQISELKFLQRIVSIQPLRCETGSR